MQKKTNQELMFDENQKLVYFVLRKKFPQYIKNEDVQQIAFIGLWKACLYFNKKNVKFSSTNATYMISHEILNFLQRDMNKGACKISLDETLYDSDNASIGSFLYDESQEISIDQISSNKIVEDYINMQTNNVQKIIRLLMNGYNQNEIGSMLGTSRAYINSVVKEVRKELSIMLESTK